MTLAAVSYAVKRGEKIAKEAGCRLNDWVIWGFKDAPPLVYFVIFVFKSSWCHCLLVHCKTRAMSIIVTIRCNNNKLTWLVYSFNIYSQRLISVCFWTSNRRIAWPVIVLQEKNKAPFLQQYEGWGFIFLQTWILNYELKKDLAILFLTIQTYKLRNVP